MIPRHRNPSVLAGLVALAATIAAGEARAAFQDVYSAGHADVNISYDSASNSLHLDYEFGSNAVINGMVLGVGGAGEREADTITVFIDPANSTVLGPAGLPAPYAGNTLYVAPQTSAVGRPFLGTGAESIEPGVFQNDTLTLTLTGFSQQPAGGNFVLWQIGGEATPFMNSADGFSAADHVDVLAGSHDHFNWGFTAQGIYDLNFTATGTLQDGTVLSTDGVYRFQVGAAPSAVPEPGSLTLALMGLGSAGLVFTRGRKGRPAPVAAP
jgi:surface-anchored protein